MKNKIVKAIFVTLVILLILAMVALYFYEVLVLKVPYTQNLVRSAAVVCAGVGTLVKLLAGTGRKSLLVYEKAYANEIGTAFKNEPRLRKKLLSACRFYDESNYKKALKNLFALLREAEISKDKAPVLMFIALCYTDANLPQEAIKAYNDLLRIDPGNAQAHSNLGLLYMHVGDWTSALAHYDRSIELKPENYYAYINRANYHFKMQNLPDALTDALRALEIKNNGKEAASLLTIIYALQGDEENRKKYYHIAITSGHRPQDLNAAIEYYKNAIYTEV